MARGWTSLLLGVASDRPRGTKVRRGEFLGRALGPIGVELRRDGRADFARLHRSFICSAVKWRQQPLNCDATHKQEFK